MMYWSTIELEIETHKQIHIHKGICAMRNALELDGHLHPLP